MIQMFYLLAVLNLPSGELKASVSLFIKSWTFGCIMVLAIFVRLDNGVEGHGDK